MNTELLIQLATSEAAIALYISVALFVYRHLKIKFDWNTERWEGIVAHAFNAAENSGFLHGHRKLDMALQIFNEQYRKTYGKSPSPAEIQDAALDLARLAFELKFAQPRARPPISHDDLLREPDDEPGT